MTRGQWFFLLGFWATCGFAGGTFLAFAAFSQGDQAEMREWLLTELQVTHYSDKGLELTLYEGGPIATDSGWPSYYFMGRVTRPMRTSEYPLQRDFIAEVHVRDNGRFLLWSLYEDHRKVIDQTDVNGYEVRQEREYLDRHGLIY